MPETPVPSASVVSGCKPYPHDKGRGGKGRFLMTYPSKSMVTITKKALDELEVWEYIPKL
jgi:hypothetical protein